MGSSEVEDTNGSGVRPMVLTVGYPRLENHETWGTPRLGGLSTKIDGVRDLGHPPVRVNDWEILKLKIRIAAGVKAMVSAIVVPTSRKSRDMGHPRLRGAGKKENGVRDLGHPPMVPAVVDPRLEKRETWGTPRLGGVSTKIDGVRDLGHPTV